MIVIDASVIVKLVTQEAGSELAVERLGREPDRIAPDWIRAEIASALAKKVRLAGLPLDQAEASLAALELMMPDVVPTSPLLAFAMGLAAVLDHALYDCLYLALAIDLDCIVLTTDAKFVSAAAATVHGRRVELLDRRI